MFAERKGGAIELIGEKAVALSQRLGPVADLIGEVDCLLIDEKFFKAE
jgi:hypothetical protein